MSRFICFGKWGVERFFFCLGAELKQGGGTEWFEIVIGSEQQLGRKRRRMSGSTAGRIEVPI